MRRIRTAVLLLLFTGGTAAAQSREPAARAVPREGTEYFTTQFSYLASDRLGGRAPGTRGGLLAARHIAQEFARAGLIPLGHSYLHDVPLRGWRTDTARSRLTLGTGTAALHASGRDRILLWSGTGRNATVAAPLVFAGHGIRAPEFGWNDYRTDVRGRIVVVLAGEPAATPAQPRLFDGDAMSWYGRWTYKVEEAARQGAAGVLLVHTAEAAGYDWDVVRSSWGAEVLALAHDSTGSPPVVGWISAQLADAIAVRAGSSLALLSARATQRDAAPVLLAELASVQLYGAARRFDSPNVVGVLPGRRQDSSAEYVAFTAHHDHFGIGAAVAGDSIYNGAYDNAAGVALLLELVRAFTALPAPLERSLLFIATTAEEAGMLGATHFVEHPPVPLDRIVASINLEGANLWGETDDIGAVGAERSTLGELLGRAAAAHGMRAVAERAPQQGFFFRSDHFPFARAGVPAISIEHGLEFRGRELPWGAEVVGAYLARNYHTPSDEFDATFDLRGAVQQARVLFTLGRMLANTSDRPDWYPDARVPAAPRPRDAAQRTLN